MTDEHQRREPWLPPYVDMPISGEISEGGAEPAKPRTIWALVGVAVAVAAIGAGALGIQALTGGDSVELSSIQAAERSASPAPGGSAPGGSVSGGSAPGGAAPAPGGSSLGSGVAPTAMPSEAVPLTVAPTSRATQKNSASGAPATGSPQVDQSQLSRAESYLAKARSLRRLALTSAKATKLDKQYTKALLQLCEVRVEDLKAGRPNARHRALELRVAKLNLRMLQQAWKDVQADPNATESDRANVKLLLSAAETLVKAVRGGDQLVL